MTGENEHLQHQNFHSREVSLRSYFLREASVNLQKIGTAVAQWQLALENSDCLNEIKSITRALFDLAMIHGYDGVENMAQKLLRIVEHLVKSSAHYDADVAAKMNAAVQAIRQVVEMESGSESQMTVETVNRQVAAAEREVQNRTAQLAESFAPLLSFQKSPRVIAAPPSPPIFDIREDAAIFDLAEIDFAEYELSV
jgi:chemotaxis protein histidine kinase CheA